MIPTLIDIGSLWKVLPPGVHDTTLIEIKKTFATNDHRQHLFNGLESAIKALHRAGCRTIYLDGSFVTEKPLPGDYDACWCPDGVDINLLDPVFTDFSNRRRAQKLKYYGELFPSTIEAVPGRVFLEYFQKDKFTGNPKGMLCIKLKDKID
jgi:hypothetical protein